MSASDIKEWLKLAEHDIDTADLLIKEKGHADIIVYHLHQATEKLLKSLLIKQGKQPQKIHFLDKLLGEVIEEVSALEEVKDEILELNLYLPKLRYPSGDEITFEEAKDLFSKFTKIKDSLLKTINIPL